MNRQNIVGLTATQKGFCAQGVYVGNRTDAAQQPA
jgi:hypothetical protein